MGSEPTSPLFVRLPTASAEKLSRAAFELKTPKRELVADLVDRYLGAEDLAVGPVAPGANSCVDGPVEGGGIGLPPVLSVPRTGAGRDDAGCWGGGRRMM